MVLMLAPLVALSMNVAASRPDSDPGAKSQTEAAVTVDQTEELLKAYDTAQFQHHYADALKIAERLQADNPEGQAVIAAMRASSLLGLKRDAEAKKLIADSEYLAPASADASRIVFFGALLSNRMDFAADALDRMIARAPDMVREIDLEAVNYFLSNEPKGEETRNDDRRVALARLGYGGDSEAGHWQAARAVRILVKRGDVSGAAELLQYANEPQAVENMLIQRRYAALWPRLEELAGPHLQNVRSTSVRGAEKAYEEAPTDHEALQHYVNALRHAGRADEAIALRSKLPTTIGGMSSADEQMGWAVNNVALALHEQGKRDEADALFAMLNDAPMPKEFWRVSMKINRLELLVLDGKFEQALPLIEPTAKTEGSAYAEQLVRRLRFCTLSRLGRAEEAATFLPDLLSHAQDAPGPTIDGLLCAGQTDKAEQVALAALNNPDETKRTSFEEDFVRQLQSHRLTSDDPSVWQERWQQLRSRPAIAKEFDRLGRDMPANLLPPAAADVTAR